MSIHVNVNGTKKITNIFANINGTKKEIQSVWVNKNGVPTKVFGNKPISLKMFIVTEVGGSGKYSRYSEDGGINWISNSIGSNNAITYGNGKFMLGLTGNTQLTDFNMSITVSAVNSSAIHYEMAYGNGCFVTVTDKGIWYYDGPDEYGIHKWTEYYKSPTTCVDVCYGNGKFVCVGSDGIYTINTKVQSGNFTCVCYGNGRFVASGSAGTYYSDDGTTWTKISTFHNFVDITYGNGKFFAVKDTKGVFYSSDGISWSSVILDYAVKAIAYGDGNVVAVGSYGKGFHSADGITWENVSENGLGNTSSYTWGSLAYSADGGYGDTV